MPNVKIFVDSTEHRNCAGRLTEALPSIREMLCHDLRVDLSACQFAVIAVETMPDLPLVNVEISILRHPDRTRDHLLSVCHKLRDMVEEATRTHAAIRIASLDPDSYVALK